MLQTTYSHHDPEIRPAGLNHPRYRLGFAMSRPLQTAEVRPLGHHVASLLEIFDCFDRGAVEPARLVYVPRVPEARLGALAFHRADSEALDDPSVSNGALDPSARRRTPRATNWGATPNPHQRRSPHLIGGNNAMKSANTNDGDDFVVVSIDLSAAHMRAQTPWSADDKRFFEKNRDRQYRMREEFPGEFPNEDNDGWRPGFVSRVIVRRLSENMRRRMRVWVVAQGAYSNDDEFLGAMFSQAVNGPITSDEFNVWLHKTRYTGPKQ